MFLSFFCFSKIFFFPQGEWYFEEKRAQKCKKHLFLSQNLKTQKKFKIKQQKQKRKKDHKMHTKKPLSLVTKNTQKLNNTNEFFQMERSNTRKNKQKQKHKTQKPNYPFNQHNSKNCRENNILSWTENKTRIKTTTKTQNKNKKHQKQNQHRNRKAETYTMKTKTRTTEEK